MTAPVTAVTHLDTALRLARAAGTDVVLSADTAQGLLDRLGELCEEHVACPTCGAVFCRSCGLGEGGVECADGPLETHCVACLDSCPSCLREAVREFAEQEATA